MAQQTVNIGTSANKGNGDPLRTAFKKINENFTEVYGKIVALENGTLNVVVSLMPGIPTSLFVNALLLKSKYPV